MPALLSLSSCRLAYFLNLAKRSRCACSSEPKFWCALGCDIARAWPSSSSARRCGGPYLPTWLGPSMPDELGPIRGQLSR
eukprot:2081501-Pleurochrysis_carterae.AAC.1